MKALKGLERSAEAIQGHWAVKPEMDRASRKKGILEATCDVLDYYSANIHSPSLPNGGWHTLRCPLMSGLAMWISLANGSVSGQDERKGLQCASIAWFCSWTPIICHNKSIPWIVPSHKSQNKYMRSRSKSIPHPGAGPPNSANPRSAQKQPT